MTDRSARYRKKPARLEEMTVIKVACALGVSQQRVRQLEASGLKKLRVAMAEHAFRFEDFLEGRTR